MVAPDFIVPPPGLIPNAPEPAAAPPAEPERTVRAPARVLPKFTPVPAGPPTPLIVGVPAAPSLPPVAPAPVQPVPRPAASAVPGPFRLSGPRGFEVLLTVPIVVGRDPVASGAHADARPVSVVDPARSVSKTHAVIDARTGVVTVIDLHSTNGVRVQPPLGEILELAPGAPTEVAAGSTLYLGELGLRVDRLSIDTV